MPYNYCAGLIPYGFEYALSVVVDGTGANQVGIFAVGADVRVYYSNDYGITWKYAGITLAVSGYCAISDNGSYMAVAGIGDFIYVSGNYGQSWTPRALALGWRHIAISETGQYISAATYAQQSVYYSSDYGVNFVQNNLGVNLLPMAISDDGQYQITGRYDAAGQLQRSANFGVNFNPVGPARQWECVAVSASGEFQYAINTANELWRSTDFGATWGQIPGTYYDFVACSSVGDIVAIPRAATGVSNRLSLYVSTDYGLNYVRKSYDRVSYSWVSLDNDASHGCITKGYLEAPYKLGQILEVDAELQIENETLDESFDSGALYKALGRHPVAGDFFYCIGTQDFSGGELLSAKTNFFDAYALAAGDVFVVNTSLGADGVRYVDGCPGNFFFDYKIALVKANGKICSSSVADIPALGYLAGKKFVLSGYSLSLKFVNSGNFGALGIALYLCIKDSNEYQLEDEYADFSSRSGANDIFLFNNTDAAGTEAEIDISEYTNLSFLKEVILRARILYAAPNDQVYNFYSGERTRNKAYHLTNTGDPANYDNYEAGMCRFLINPATSSFGVEDWKDGDYNDFIGTSVSGVAVVDIDYSYTVSIVAVPESGTMPLSVKFSADSIIKITSGKYSWSFGDGAYSSESNPVHVYRLPGKYTVNLTVTINGIEYTATEIVRVYEKGQSAKFNVTKPDTCLRFAVPQKSPIQGRGWSHYSGADWPNPLGLIGERAIVDDFHEKKQLVIDCNNFRTYWLGKDDHWQDGANEDYAGSEVEAEILFPEHTPPIGASAKLKHSQYHAWLKPWFKTRRNTGDYDREGFRPNHEVDMFMRKDSNPTDAVIAKCIPKDGQVIFDRHIISPSLQPGMRIRTAPWRLAKAQMWYTQDDKGAAPPQKLMSELDWGKLLAEPVLWVSRGLNPILNRSTGADASGTYTGVATGPDGYAQSAMVMNSANSVWDTLEADLDDDFCMLIWVKNPTLPMTLFQFATGGLRIRLDAAERIIWDDGVSSIEVRYTGGVAGWTMFGVQRNGGNVEFFHNGQLLNTAALVDSTILYGDRVTLFQGAGAFFDARVLPLKLPVEAVEYYYNDVMENKGNSVCPIF